MFDKARQSDNNRGVESFKCSPQLIRRELVVIRSSEIEVLKRGFRNGFDVIDLLHMCQDSFHFQWMLLLNKNTLSNRLISIHKSSFDKP